MDEWKIQKKDKLLAITFSGTTGTDAAGMRLYMKTLQGTLYLNHFLYFFILKNKKNFFYIKKKTLYLNHRKYGRKEKSQHKFD